MLHIWGSRLDLASVTVALISQKRRCVFYVIAVHGSDILKMRIIILPILNTRCIILFSIGACF
jgi:hypothetical protein